MKDDQLFAAILGSLAASIVFLFFTSIIIASFMTHWIFGLVVCAILFIFGVAFISESLDVE